MITTGENVIEIQRKDYKTIILSRKTIEKTLVG